MSDQPEQRCQRCKRLGHEVPFEYCFTQESDQVCPEILNCWWERFDVRTCLADRLGKDVVKELESPRQQQPKILGLLELIEQAKKRQVKPSGE
ncbi:MAG: hypothetical protein HN742_42705 [Lentisphaerae bacterium]|jgi:hypothetical protein|nr:hypothetical protein [Lentisphaerota bacterium]MBT4816817.1 hypothetical protein [Lentisphaerota bacterium]MBT5609488.1 hypothetical protein [Lentisphaerota bacterium]MBT7057701.1 hypothetical protein [Lentisphaerota bacterium]MBT7848650.1 hypothetical protein [Lentisphaerota bacterium]